VGGRILDIGAGPNLDPPGDGMRARPVLSDRGAEIERYVGVDLEAAASEDPGKFGRPILAC
jgi:hypothetical protein